MNIRTATPNDAQILHHIETLCFPHKEAASLQSIQERIKAFSDCFLVAEINGEIVGFVNGACTNECTISDEMYENTSLHQPDGAFQSVFGLDVAPDFQKQGIAKQLMKALIEQARIKQKRGVFLTCKQALIGFYEQFGFVCLGISESTHGDTQWFDMRLDF